MSHSRISHLFVLAIAAGAALPLAAEEVRKSKSHSELIRLEAVDARELKKVVDAALQLWHGSAKRVATPPGDRRGVSVRKIGGVRVVAHAESRSILIEAPNADELRRVRALVALLDASGDGSPPRSRQPGATTDTSKEAKPLQRTKSLRAVRVDITAGKVPVSDFVRFLSDHSGLPAVASGVKEDDTVHVVSTIRNADLTVVKELLGASGWSMEQKTLATGRQVIRVFRTGQKRSGDLEGNPVIRVQKKGAP